MSEKVQLVKRYLPTVVLLGLAIAPFFLGSQFYRDLFSNINANLNMALAIGCGFAIILSYVAFKNNRAAFLFYLAGIGIMFGKQLLAAARYMTSVF